jgi:hypothetical protein
LGRGIIHNDNPVLKKENNEINRNRRKEQTAPR